MTTHATAVPVDNPAVGQPINDAVCQEAQRQLDGPNDRDVGFQTGALGSAIDVVEVQHDLLGCRVNGHDWRRLTDIERSHSGHDFECGECDARGVLVRPMGVVVAFQVLGRWQSGDRVRELRKLPDGSYYSATLENGRDVGGWTLGTWDQFGGKWWTDEDAIAEVSRTQSPLAQRVA